MLKYYWWRVKLYFSQKQGKKVKHIFEIGSPYTSFYAGVSYSYMNQWIQYQDVFNESSGMHVPNVEDLKLLSYEIQTLLMYTPLMVWAIEIDNPVVAHITYNKIETTPMHPFYKANVLYISSL